MSADYETKVDIANRALQMCGVTRIVTFDDDSKNAASVKFVYDKVRRAELRRNVWRFAIRRAFLRPVNYDTMLVDFPAPDLTKTWPAGSIVYDGQNIYQARTTVPTDIVPADNPNYWELYFGPTSATPYDEGIVYQAGEMTYDPTTGSPQVYLSLMAANDEDPSVVPAWNAQTIYRKGDTVTQAAVVYQSNAVRNQAIVPPAAGWETVPGTQGASRVGQKWLKLTAAGLRDLVVTYPLGTGPYSDTTSANIYLLPQGFLREAPQAPKLGNLSWAGAVSGVALNDWMYEGNYLVSGWSSQALGLRFAADVSDVRRMDPMFCEGLAARMALEICEELTQSSDKLKNIASLYKNAMGEARTVNGIETGSVQPPEDEFISIRR